LKLAAREPISAISLLHVLGYILHAYTDKI